MSSEESIQSEDVPSSNCSNGSCLKEHVSNFTEYDYNLSLPVTIVGNLTGVWEFDGLKSRFEDGKYVVDIKDNFFCFMYCDFDDRVDCEFCSEHHKRHGGVIYQLENVQDILNDGQKQRFNERY